MLTHVMHTVTGLAATALSHAVAATPSPTDTGTARLVTIIGRLTGWIVGILAAIATLFLTIGGLRYLAAGGDPAEVERAKGSMRSAAIGYALAILAPVLLAVLNAILR